MKLAEIAKCKQQVTPVGAYARNACAFVLRGAVNFNNRSPEGLCFLVKINAHHIVMQFAVFHLYKPDFERVGKAFKLN